MNTTQKVSLNFTSFDVADVTKQATRVRRRRIVLLALFLFILFVIFVLFKFPTGAPQQKYWLLGIITFFSPAFLTKAHFENTTWYIDAFYTVSISGVIFLISMFIDGPLRLLPGLIGLFLLFRGADRISRLLYFDYPSAGAKGHEIFRIVRARRVQKPIAPTFEKNQRYRNLSFFWHGLATFILFGGYFLSYRLGVHFGGVWAFVLPLFLGITTWLMAAIFFRIAKNSALLDAKVILKQDSRPPITLFRSFGDDAKFLSWAGFPLLPWNLLFDLEDILDKVLRHYGPFLAIGDPTTRKRHSGANRVFLSHEKWKAEASRLIQISGVIVYIPGTTEGVFWELGQIKKKKKVSKTIIVFPPEDEERQEEQNPKRWQMILQVFEGTMWEVALTQCKKQDVLLIVLREDGSLASLTHVDPKQDDYEMAMVLGLFEVFKEMENVQAREATGAGHTP